MPTIRVSIVAAEALSSQVVKVNGHRPLGVMVSLRSQ